MCHPAVRSDLRDPPDDDSDKNSDNKKNDWQYAMRE
jgi:hypothetical protein